MRSSLPAQYEASQLSGCFLDDAVMRDGLADRVPEGLLLGFRAVDDRELRRGVDVLAAAIRKLVARAG